MSSCNNDVIYIIIEKRVPILRLGHRPDVNKKSWRVNDKADQSGKHQGTK